MTRTPFPLAATLVLFAAPAFGQGVLRAPPAVVLPGPHPFTGTGYPLTPFVGYSGGYGYGYGGYGPSYFGYPYFNPWLSNPTFTPTLAPPPLLGAGVSSPPGAPTPSPVASEQVASLTVEFPAPADVWLNGVRVADPATTQTLASPPLRAGASFIFALTARWTAGGRAYEWERTVTLAAGERSRVTVAGGFPVGVK